MAHIRPFVGIHFNKQLFPDISDLIAPPYDVLDEASKAALQSKHPNNIVSIDLPHLPPKSVGPDATYEEANQTFQRWLAEGTLTRDRRPATYAYAQTFQHGPRTIHRHGMICLVRLSPFGAGEVVPHEKTYDAPIEDRLKLMRATGLQLSPIFGLFSDPRNEVTSLLFKNLAKPDLTATLDGVQNDLWSVIDADIENPIIDLLKHKPIYIADGHHRYTTALQYQKELEAQNGGPLPPNHPANYCMFVLVSMQDPGLLILPTHRLIGGLSDFSPAAFKASLLDNFDMTETLIRPDQLLAFADTLEKGDTATFGLYDGKSRKAYTLHLKNPQLLTSLSPDKSESWQRLDVAILQRYLLDEILQPHFAGGKELVKGYTADPSTIARDVDGSKFQIALLLKSTPLHALEDLSKHNEVMPQKSTYFFPKLATGMVFNPLR
ncbi:MAG TPA: DUF1015 domain-containing protein [Tepidisphaeraceae bacterium]|jgi:uncharacterized protein (DUF1015 family)|nr:DUF1015 domain-containing protein [Tepidisphaeraceae bacterium]